jgi:type IV secretion system protein TrbE
MYKEHLNNTPGFSDLLNYAHIVDDGIILNKDGAFLVTYKFRGPDINSASSGELDALVKSFNRMMTFLEDGWMVHVDEIRIPSITYPDTGAFPNSVAALIDEERRQFYEDEGSHYENLQFLTLVWKFPLPIIKTARHWFVEGIDKNQDIQNLNQLLVNFINIVERAVALLSTELIFEKLNTEDLLTFLGTCISGKTFPIATPASATFLDVILGRHNVIGGYLPKIGDANVIVLSIIGFLNSETIPGLLEEMSTYPIIYRWSNRFVPLSEPTAEREIRRYQKNWNNKVKGFMGIIREVISGKPSEKINVDALEMSDETTEALTINSNHSVRLGYWTSALVLMCKDEDLETVNEVVKELAKYLEQTGFSCDSRAWKLQPSPLIFNLNKSSPCFTATFHMVRSAF